MKLLKIFSLFAVIAFFGIILNSCTEDSTNPVDTKQYPNAPTNLKATSIDATTIKIKWDKSASETNDNFKGYRIEITGDGTSALQPREVAKGTSDYTWTNLVEGTVYTFKVFSITTDTLDSKTAPSVAWSPATRFKTDIRVYEYKSTRGSGLVFQNSTGDVETLTYTMNDEWDICLDTRDGKFSIGSPQASDYTDANGNYTSGSKAKAKVFTIYNVVNNVSSLDDVFDSQSIDNLHISPYPEQFMIEFTSVNKGFVILGKTASNNFVKIFVKDNAGTILQGTADDRYVQLEISYQMTPGNGYAIIQPGFSKEAGPVRKSNK
ncbi:MAG: Fibronectin type protein [Bacteroidota bacterium]|nr:Fibronectin type protein [Bacteroidota bacterium]